MLRMSWGISKKKAMTMSFAGGTQRKVRAKEAENKNSTFCKQSGATSTAVTFCNEK